MAMIRLKPFATTTTAIGTAGGLITVTSTAGLARHAHVTLSKAAWGGLRVEVVRVVSATQFLARVADSFEYRDIRNKADLSSVPDAASVSLEEQWVPDLYQDDVPLDLAIPVK